jgi:hypothetical protein
MMSTGDVYILVDRQPILHADNEAWWQWYKEVEANRRVGLTHLDGEVTVSTVFTAMDLTPDHCLFETLVFGGEHDGEHFRCNSWEEAEKLHTKVVALLRGARPWPTE